MIRKSNHQRSEPLRKIGDQVQAFQDATDEVDEAVARVLQLNRTDLRCLSVIARAGAITASELAASAGLTRGAMTTALDRIEAAGFARRVSDDGSPHRPGRADRSGAEGNRRPLRPPRQRWGEAPGETLHAELIAVLRYLEDGQALQRAQAERLRDAG